MLESKKAEVTASAEPPQRTQPIGLQRILILAPSLRSYGGVQTYTQDLLGAIQNLKGEDSVRLLTIAEDPEFKRNGQRALKRWVKLKFLAQAIAQAASWRPDLVICLHLATAPVARVMRQLTGTPYWLVLHGVEVWGTLPKTKIDALLGAQRYIALSRFTFDSAVACHGIAHSPPLSLLPPFLRPIPPVPDSRATPGSEEPVVLTVARLGTPDRFKGVDVMLEAWPTVLQHARDAKYWIVGEGEERPRLEARARELGIADSVRFLGKVDAAELDAAYERCTLFAMPARTDLNPASPDGEGFGIVYAEAMARGKPVVGPCCGAPAEFIRPEFGALVDPTDSESVARALIDLVTHPDRARASGKAGREWVGRELTYDRFCERLGEALASAPARD